MPYEIILLKENGLDGPNCPDQIVEGTALVKGKNLAPILEFLRYAWISENRSFEVAYVQKNE